MKDKNQQSSGGPQWESYVRYPKSDAFGLAIEHDLLTMCGDTDIETDRIRRIEQAESFFRAEGFSIAAFQAIVYANEAGLYPPRWAIEYLADRLSVHIKGKPLDVAFGITGNGLGSGRRTSAKDRLRILNRDRILAITMMQLLKVGLSRTTASNMVASAWMKRTSEDISGTAVRNALKVMSPELKEEAAAINAAQWSDDEVKKLLRQFGREGVPLGVRRRFGIFQN